MASKPTKANSVVELRADTLEWLDQALNAIRAIPGIASTETSILLSTHKA